MISVCLSVYSIQGVKLNNERAKYRKLCGYTLKLRLSKFFSRSNIFSLFQPCHVLWHMMHGNTLLGPMNQ